MSKKKNKKRINQLEKEVENLRSVITSQVWKSGTYDNILDILVDLIPEKNN